MLFALIVVLDIGLWIRGQFVADRFFLTGQTRGSTDGNTSRFYVTILDNVPNGINYAHAVSEHEFPSPKGFSYDRVRFDDNVHIRFRAIERILGVTFLRRQAEVVDQTSWDIAIAHRTIVIVSLAAFALFARLGWRRRFAPGYCQKCGYDLRVTPERCPECGAVPQKT